MGLSFFRVKFLEFKAIFLFSLVLLIFINLGLAVFCKITEILILSILILSTIFYSLIYSLWFGCSNVNISNAFNNSVMFIKQLNIVVYFSICFLCLVFLLTCWDVFSQLFRFDEIKDLLIFYVFLFSNIFFKVKRFSFFVVSNFRILSMFAFRQVSEYSGSNKTFIKSKDLLNMNRNWRFKPVERFDIDIVSNLKEEFVDKVNNAKKENGNSYNLFRDENFLHKMWVDNYFGCRGCFGNKDEVNFGKFKQYLREDENFVSIHPASLFEIDECDNTKILLPHTSCQIRFIGGLDLSTLKFEKKIRVETKSFQNINSYKSGDFQYFFSNLVKLLWIRKQIIVDSSLISEELESSTGLQLSAFKQSQEFIEFLGRRKEQLYPLLVEMNKDVSIKDLQDIAIFAEGKYGFKIVDCSHTSGFGKNSPLTINIENLD